MRARPLRWLTQLTLAICAIAVLIVSLTGGQDTSADAESAGATHSTAATPAPPSSPTTSPKSNSSAGDAGSSTSSSPPTSSGGSTATGSGGTGSTTASDRATTESSRSTERDTAPTASTADAVTIDITTLTPQVLTPADTLTLTATITNGTENPLQGAEANLKFRKTSFSARDQLDAWSKGDYSESEVTTKRAQALPSSLAPGASATVTFSLPAASLGWSTAADSWGPQGISVEVATSSGVVAKAPTYLIWLPSQDVAKTDVSVLIPLVATDSMPASATDLTRVANVVKSTRGQAGVSWALDPALLTSTGTDSTNPVVNALSTVANTSNVHLLPYADPDIAAIAHSGNSDFYAQALHDAATVASQSGLTWGSTVDLAWPENSRLDQQTIDMVAAGSPNATIITSDTALPAAKESEATPSASSTVKTSSGASVPVLAADSTLSTEFVSVDYTDPTSVQRLLADSAMLTLDNVGTTRHVLITTPRNWDGDPLDTAAAFQALNSAPWIAFEPMSTAPTDASVARATPPDSQVDATEITPTQLASLSDAKSQLSAFANVTDDPTSFMAANERTVLSPISTVYRSNPQARATALSAVLNSVSKTVNQVSVVQGSSINLIADSGEIPITVQNSSTQAVNVTVSLQAQDPRLQVDQSVQTKIASKSQSTVRIPVEAIANGDVELNVVLQNPQGQTFTTVDSLTVRVHADWENVGTAVLGGLLAVAFVIGLTRTIRRRRRTRREVQH